MAQNAPKEESVDNLHARLAHAMETKQYIDQPEILPWYKKDLGELKPSTRELFENYSHIPPSDVESHIHKIRDEAFKVFPYPCVGNWGFLNRSIVDSPCYKEVLDRLSKGEQYLDIGCCMGQDIRTLANDGAPHENMYGSDLKGDFWDIGYNLFLDKDTLKSKFITADVFDAESGLKELDGKLDMVHAASFFHLWDWDAQVKAVKRVVALMKQQPGVLIFGRQGGMSEAGKLSETKSDLNMYWHNPESWEKLWKQVGDETGTTWKVEAFLRDEDLSKKMNSKLVPAGARSLTFSIRRV